MIYIPSTHLGSPKPIKIGALNKGLSGQYRFTLRDELGRILMKTDWEDNLITDVGLDCLSYDHVLTNLGKTVQQNDHTAYVGSDSTPASASDINLGSQLGSATAAWQSTPYSNWYGGAPNYEKGRTVTYRFLQGVGTGTIREVGIANSAAMPGNLFARSVIGTPFVKAADHILDVDYRVVGWPDLGTKTKVINIAGVDYNTTTRLMNVHVNNASSMAEYQQPFTFLSGYYGGGYCVDLAAFGGVTSSPTITTPPTYQNAVLGFNNTNYGFRDAYTPGDHYLWQTYGATIDQLTTAEGTGNLRFVFVAGYSWVIKTFFDQVSNPGQGIPKDDTNELLFTYKFSWARHL